MENLLIGSLWAHAQLAEWYLQKINSRYRESAIRDGTLAPSVWADHWPALSTTTATPRPDVVPHQDARDEARTVRAGVDRRLRFSVLDAPSAALTEAADRAPAGSGAGSPGPP